MGRVETSEATELLLEGKSRWGAGRGQHGGGEPRAPSTVNNYSMGMSSRMSSGRT